MTGFAAKRSRGPARIALLARLIAIAVCLCAAAAAAHEPAPDAPGGEAAADPEVGHDPVAPIPLEEVPDRAESTHRELDAFPLGETSRQTLERIGIDLDAMLPKLNSKLAQAHAAVAAQLAVPVLETHEIELGAMQDRLGGWEDELDRQLAGLRGDLERLDAIAASWRTTDEFAARDGSAGTTAARIAAVRSEIAAKRSLVTELRSRTLTLRDRLVDPSAALASGLEELQAATETRLRGILQVNRPSPWSPSVRESLVAEWKTAGPQYLTQWLAECGQFVREQQRMLAFQLALLLFLGLALRRLRVRAHARAEDDYDLRDVIEVFEHPWAMASLIAVLLTAPLHPLAPRGIGLFAGLIVAAVALRIGRRLLEPAVSPLVWLFVIVFVVDRARDLLGTTPTLSRVVFLVEMIGAASCLLWLLRPSRLVEIPAQLRRVRSLRLLGVTIRVVCVVLLLAIVADLVGLGDLTNLLGNAALRSGYLGLGIFVLLMVVRSLAAFALVLRPLRLLRSISRHRVLVRNRIDRLLSLLAAGVWVILLLGQVGLLGTVTAGVGQVLGAAVSLGTVSLSLGDVATFALTVWLTFQTAHLVDFVLQEDVFTRVRTGRGVPYAISGLIRYSLIVLGFLVGLAAMGVELTKLTVIAGGLGVGIGFGLQNVVNNFVSGLILLFERPIQVGDTIALPDCWGSMKHIGIRASVIHTFDGAEVIIPNGMLISEKVTNWTLSDKRRRIELDVGVQYGTPAQRMIDLLLEVARANSKVIDDPEPRAFFVAFGDSSLDFKLRVWSELRDDGYTIRSELAVAVQQALEAAGIGVPFPQRDLHLKSVSADAALLRGIAGDSSPHPIPNPGESDET